MVTANNLFWKNLLTFAIGSTLFLGLFLEQYQWMLVSVFFTTPLIISRIRAPHYFSIPLSKKFKVIGYPLLVIEGILWALLSSGYDFSPHQNFYTFSFTIAQVIGFISLLFFIQKSTELSKGASNLSMVYLLIIIGINDSLLFLNYPRGHSYFIEQVITDKYIHKSKGTTYYLKFDNTNLYTNINVDSTEYINIYIGDTIEFEYKTGKLNYNGLIGHKHL